MSYLEKQEWIAIEAVARRFSATWRKGSDFSGAYITVAGKRIAVDIVTLKPCGTGRSDAGKPRLRFDKVATRLMERLQAALGEFVPDGTTVLLTITAPIRLPAKTAAAVEDKIHNLLEQKSGPRDVENKIHGNRIRIRILRNASMRALKLIGFVHNPDSDPLLLLNMTSGLLERIGSKPGKRATKPVGDRWLVVKIAGGISSVEIYRYLCLQLHMSTDFERILMVFDDGRVEVLPG